MTDEIYFIDYGAAKIYYKVLDNGMVETGGSMVTISREKFLDYLATAKVLGHTAGKL